MFEQAIPTMKSFFSAATRILQGFGFLCKLLLLLFKPYWD